MALSPDSRRLAFAESDRLYLRAMDQRELTVVDGSEGAVNPFFSPGGEWVGFWADGRIRKAPVSGGAVVTVCEAQSPYGVRWETDDSIVFGQAAGVFRVAASGGAPEVLLAMDEPRRIAYGAQLLPGGDHRLFTLAEDYRWDDAQIVVESLETGERRIVVERGMDARYVASGHLVYFLDGTLMAAPFDPSERAVTGTPVPMPERVRFTLGQTGTASFSVSDTGSLVYQEAAGRQAHRTLVWVGRDGREEMLAAEPRPYNDPRISPDGSRIAVGADGDVWVWDVARTTLTRFNLSPQAETSPVWAPAEGKILFESHREGQGNVFARPATGAGASVRVSNSARHQTPLSLSPDGNLAPDRGARRRGAAGRVARALPGRRRRAPLLHSKFNETNGTFAPNAAYMSPEQARGAAVDERTDVWAGALGMPPLSGGQGGTVPTSSSTQLVMSSRSAGLDSSSPVRTATSPPSGAVL